ncbi:hypothetical protein B0H17DRAFT_1097440 [Mycena rosella]|uniref:Uncharacterized protein n=1 Tax=Mycena rosella TaxID=1033263 RepID=A0AAD7CQB5_MYCRO|nr:hypothetical protein B0H17DRAFT_1097440 [Mycena rosella]
MVSESLSAVVQHSVGRKFRADAHRASRGYSGPAFSASRGRRTDDSGCPRRVCVDDLARCGQRVCRRSQATRHCQARIRAMSGREGSAGVDAISDESRKAEPTRKRLVMTSLGRSYEEQPFEKWAMGGAYFATRSRDRSRPHSFPKQAVGCRFVVSILLVGTFQGVHDALRLRILSRPRPRVDDTEARGISQDRKKKISCPSSVESSSRSASVDRAATPPRLDCRAPQRSQSTLTTNATKSVDYPRTEWNDRARTLRPCPPRLLPRQHECD